MSTAFNLPYTKLNIPPCSHPSTYHIQSCISHPVLNPQPILYRAAYPTLFPHFNLPYTELLIPPCSHPSTYPIQSCISHPVPTLQPTLYRAAYPTLFSPSTYPIQSCISHPVLNPQPIIYRAQYPTPLISPFSLLYIKLSVPNPPYPTLFSHFIIPPVLTPAFYSTLFPPSTYPAGGLPPWSYHSIS